MVKYVVKDLIKKVESAGYIEDHTRGDHHMFKNPETGKTVPIPYTRLKDTLAPGTAHSILRLIKNR